MKTLYIRSQDKYKLVKFKQCLSVTNNNAIVDDIGNILGTYITTYDAVKVLDEIQEVLTKSLGETIVYQMPQRNKGENIC